MDGPTFNPRLLLPLGIVVLLALVLGPLLVLIGAAFVAGLAMGDAARPAAGIALLVIGVALLEWALLAAPRCVIAPALGSVHVPCFG